MQIIHVSAECFPAIKAGGLGDVVGAIPKYLNQLNSDSKVIIPFVDNQFPKENHLSISHQGTFPFGSERIPYQVLHNNSLGFDLFMISIPGLMDREKIYGYSDDTHRFLAFQIATMEWLNTWHIPIDIVHCHDFHTGLIPFMMKNCYAYSKFHQTPSIFTIHNAQYQGQMGKEMLDYFPWFEKEKTNLLEWDNDINPMASAIKCAWQVTTVSPTYMKELIINASNGLEPLFRAESHKCSGILNGIDESIWNPNIDKMIDYHYDYHSYKKGKAQNKHEVCKIFGYDESLPLVMFIGRLVHDKGADILGDIIFNAINYEHLKMNFLVIGNGSPELINGLNDMKKWTGSQFNCYFGFDEPLAHKCYAAADYLLMPSRVEPCGLNQMYCQKYGTIPMVRTVGGLMDTVNDFEDANGSGIRFIHTSVDDTMHALKRAQYLWDNPKKKNELIQRMMQIDNSWENSAKKYMNLYKIFKG